MPKILHIPFWLLILTAALIGSCHQLRAQTQVTENPPCVLPFALNNSNLTSSNFNNNALACDTWTLTYFQIGSGLSGLTLTVQSAPAATNSTPGTFVTYPGTVSTGVNPNTSTTGAETTLSNKTVVTPWMRVQLSGLTGSGTIIGVLQGSQSVNGAGGGGGGGGGGSVNACLSAIPNSTPVSVSSSGLTQILAAVTGKTITVCHFSVGMASGVNLQLESGTGSNCATGTAAATGSYQAIAGIALDNPFSLPLSAALCVNLGSAVVGGGLLTYVQQ